MVKLVNRYVPGRLFVLFFAENCLIIVGIWLAILFHAQLSHRPVDDPTSELLTGISIAVVCQICFYYSDLYDLRTIHRRLEVFTRLLFGIGSASIIIALLFMMVPAARLHSGILELTFVAIAFLILIWRMLMEWVNRSFTAGERILLVGAGALIHALAAELCSREDLPLKLIGYVAETDEDRPVDVSPDMVLGKIEDLEEIIRVHEPERVIIAVNERRKKFPVEALLNFRSAGVKFEEGTELFESLTGRVPVESIRPSDLIFASGFRHTRVQRVYERLVGLVCSTVGLFIAAPVMLAAAVVIKLDSPGPVLFRQDRIGRGGKSFDILKFRSMRTDAEKAGPQWAAQDDPRVTRVGSFIRKFRIDELPQLINVFRGEMSFVGPRPERPYFVELLKQQIPFFDLRHSVRPGVTGWAQVSYSYGASIEDAKNKLEYDLFYVKNMSLSLDLLCVLQTVKTVLVGRGAR